MNGLSFFRKVKMITVDCEQGSEMWFQARLGLVTASNFAQVLNKGAGRGDYMDILVAERWRGVREEAKYYDKNMKHGNDTEAEARDYYAMAHSCIVEQVGFVKRDDDIGGSPDGLVGEDGMIEIKCPMGKTHVKYKRMFKTGKMPSCYVPQVQGLLWITERQWCDFVSYDPLSPTPLLTIRVERDADCIANIAAQTALFVKELKEMVKETVGEF